MLSVLECAPNRHGAITAVLIAIGVVIIGGALPAMQPDRSCAANGIRVLNEKRENAESRAGFTLTLP